MTQQGPGTNSLWEGVLTAIKGPGAERPVEPFSEALQRVVSRHIAAEESSINRYRQMLKEVQDPVVRILINELLDDEEQHHDMLRRMEAQLSAELGESLEGPFEGDERALSSRERKERASEFRELAAHESAGSKHLKDAAKDAREAGSDVLGLLLDAIAADSAKHERILKFIAKRVATTW